MRCGIKFKRNRKYMNSIAINNSSKKEIPWLKAFMSSSSLSHSLNVRFASCIKNSKFGAHSEVRQAFRICFENVVSCVAKIGLISPKRLTSYDGAIYGWAFLDGAKLNQGATCDLTTIQQHQWTWCHNKENHSQCIGVSLTFRMHKDKFLAMWNEVRT